MLIVTDTILTTVINMKNSHHKKNEIVMKGRQTCNKGRIVNARSIFLLDAKIVSYKRDKVKFTITVISIQKMKLLTVATAGR